MHFGDTAICGITEQWCLAIMDTSG
ncbi:hypothetical protein E2C01_063851 [Portunus trituberculatus]|uniref:Uncharacterized protein n=1 Tax=Portunus trituberculatus TaxID=210409 RepID=A0A5B7HA99_PORTR|nr:hypothetical protein [Portunus trituberculatus]